MDSVACLKNAVHHRETCLRPWYAGFYGPDFDSPRYRFCRGRIR